MSNSAKHTLSFLAVLVGSASADPLLVTHNDSLTTYLAGTSAVQDCRPVALQRAVRIDGTWRAGVPFGLALAANPSDPGAMSADVAGVDLGTGEAPVYETHIALPSEGVTWTVGIAFNQMQNDGSAHDSNGYQGRNWFQVSQPELLLYQGGSDTDDCVYIVFGSSYVEFNRDDTSDVFRGVNGVAGAVEHTADGTGEPDLYTLYDAHGTKAVFFGFDGDAGDAAGQLWYIQDAAGNKAYVGHATTASTAITDGYDADGRIEYAYDGNDRRYTYSYDTIDSVVRLVGVTAEVKTGGTWASPSGVSTVAEVEYNYYESGDAAGELNQNQGDNGNLQEVTVTMPASDGTHEIVRVTHYRYWMNATSGDPYTLQYIVDAEGCRQLDWASDSSFDGDHLTANETTMKPYSSAYFDYDGSRRVIETWRNGQCGCSGGVNGEHTISYSSNGGWSASAGYTSGWQNRAIVTKPDTSTETVYTDELGQVLYRVISDRDPASTSPQAVYWVTGITRDSNGYVTEVRTPASSVSYNHSTVTFTWNTSGGLVNSYVRESTGDLTGLVEEMRWQIGTTGTSYLTGSQGYQTSTLTIDGTYDLVRALVKWRWSYADSNVTTAKAEGDSTTTTAFKTAMAYTFHASGAVLMPKTIVTTMPAVSTGQNGSNSSNTSSVYLDASGRRVWDKSPSGIIGYTGYQNGRVQYRVQDADTGLTGASAFFENITIQTGFETSGTAFHRVTTYETDDIPGGVTIAHDGDESETVVGVLADRRIVHVGVPLTTGSTWYGPASYSVSNHAGQTEFSATVAISTTATAPTAWVDETDTDPILALDTGSLFRVSTNVYSESGAMLEESRTYFEIPASGAGSEGTHYDATEYLYDDMGRRVGVRDAAETITRTTYDAIGRASAQYVGTNDNDSGTFGVSFESTGTSDMVKTSDTVYDAGAAGGNSLVTKTTAYVVDGATDKRETTYAYDERSRRILTTNPQAPHTFVELDNLGRTKYVGQFTSTASIDIDPSGGVDLPSTETTNRTALSATSYDEMGRTWKTSRYKITQSTGASGVTIDTETWYDAEGRTIKQRGQQLTKTIYDRIGRATHQYVLMVDNDGSTYANADDVAGDLVLEQTQTLYNDSDEVVMRVAVSREHDDYGASETTGDLDSNADSDDLLVTAANLSGRADITAMWYDDLGRMTTTAAYGTNAGSNFDRDGLSAPSATTGNDTALVTTVTYNDDGTQWKTTDADTVETRYAYDDAGRQVTVISNYVNGTPNESAQKDDDHYVRTVYTDGHVVKTWVDLDGDGTIDSDDQVTRYVYGVTKGGSAGDSKISHKGLLRAVIYPDSSNINTADGDIDASDTDIVFYAYNAQSQPVYMKDQSGNIIETTYDTGGRVTVRAVTTLDGDFDGAVRRIETAYNTRGMVSTVTQYDAASSGSITDEVGYTYDDWGPVSVITQDHDSAVASGGTQYTMSYDYTRLTSTGGWRGLTMDDVTLPDGTVVDYPSSLFAGSIGGDGKIGRTSQVKVGTVVVAEYNYLGVDRVVRTDLPEPDYYKTLAASSNYDRLDRFGRVTADVWTADLATDRNLVSTAITYNDRGGVKSVDDQAWPSADWKYNLDKQNRLYDTARGTLGIGGALSATAGEEAWTLSQTGNWLTHEADLNNDTDYADAGEEDGVNTGSGFFNNANEWLQRDTDGDGTADVTMSYDEVGNMVDDGEDYDYVYDAFGRLRQVKNRSTAALVAEYRYNGFNQRIAAHFDVDGDATVETVANGDPWWYFAFDARWRTVARAVERNANTPIIVEHWVHHHAGLVSSGSGSYIDSVILRDRDTYTSGAPDGTLDERVYYLQNWRNDTVALITDAGDQVEQVRYEPYGSPFGIPAGDVDASGAVDGTDATAVTAWYNAPSYDVRGDLDMDGDIDTTDLALLEDAKDAAATLGLYQLSMVDNRKGYAGYELLAELSEAKWDVRNRVLNSKLGRSLTGAVFSRYAQDEWGTCEENTTLGGRCWSHPDYQATLSSLQLEIQALGCPLPDIRCNQSDRACREGWDSYHRPPNNSSCEPVIGICPGNLSGPARQCTRLIHELTHALQLCRQSSDPACPRRRTLPSDWSTFGQCMIREMEAYCRSGDCCTLGDFEPSHWQVSLSCCYAACGSCAGRHDGPGTMGDCRIRCREWFDPEYPGAQIQLPTDEAPSEIWWS